MHTFFHGWRRKAGVITLVMACVIFIAWMRSPVEMIHLRMTILGRKFDVASLRGELVFSSWAAQGEEDWDWGRMYIPPSLYPDRRLSDKTGGPDIAHHPYFILQYWFLVLITSLFSAYLILWKPRKGA